MINDYASLISRAKAVIDNGFSRVGKNLDVADPVDRALMLLASRAVAIGNALVLLAQHSLANEALPLLRSLLEIAAAIRWIVQDDSARRARTFLDESRGAEWDNLWNTGRLKERMRELGFPRRLEERSAMFCYDHLHGNAQGLPWGHVFKENGEAGITAEELLKIAAFLSGHVV